jgi:hypothetical protein
LVKEEEVKVEKMKLDLKAELAPPVLDEEEQKA